MNKSTKLFNFLALPVDILLIIISFALAYYIRSKAEILYIEPFSEYLKFIIILLPIWIIIFAMEGLYNIRNPKRGIAEFYSVVLAVSAGIVVMVLWLFLERTTFFSRLVIIYAWVINIILILMGRWIIHIIQIELYKHNIGIKGLLIIGNNDVAYDLIRVIKQDKGLGYELTGIVTVLHKKNEVQQKNIKILGRINEIREIYKTHHFDEMILVDPEITEKEVSDLMEFSEEKKITFKEVPNLFKVKTSNAITEVIDGIPVLEFRKTPLEGWGQVAKRIFDIVSSLILIIITSPIMIISAIAIKLDSSGPIIYKNKRVGINDREFNVYKFRYIKTELCDGKEYGGVKAREYLKNLIKTQSVRKGPIYKIINDPRKTSVGTFLEKYKIDELPQFFNVLAGTMSLVGPRPHQPIEVSKYQKEHYKVFRIKPGITGFAQISGSSDLDFADEFKLDTYYIENWSPWLDLKIIFKTPVEMFRKRKNIL